MDNRPKLHPSLFRPPFVTVRNNAELALADEMRNCIGYTQDGNICGKVLPKGLRYYCSGGCMNAAKAKGDYKCD